MHMQNRELIRKQSFGKFLNDVCHYTLEFQHLDNDSSNPFKAKFHVENGRVVPECTFGTGELKGLIASADENEPIAGARIRIYSGETLGENLVRTFIRMKQVIIQLII